MPATHGLQPTQLVPTVRQDHFEMPVAPGRTSALAIASLVLSVSWLFGVGSILGGALGYLARRQCAERHLKGDRIALAGIVIGYVGLVVTLVLLGVAAVHVIRAIGHALDDLFTFNDG
jgi:hypothetical protein